MLLAVTVSFTELISISSVVPVMMALTNEEGLAGLPSFFSDFASVARFDLNEVSLNTLLLVFLLTLLASTCLRLILLFCQTRLAHSIGAEIGKTLFTKNLNQELDAIFEQNSGELISAVSQKSNVVVYNVILPFLLLVSSCLVLVIVFVTIFFIYPAAALGIIGFIFFVYSLIGLPIRFLLRRNGAELNRNANIVVGKVQDAFGAIREIALYDLSRVLTDEYAKSDQKMRRAQAVNQFLGGAPKVVVEFFAITILLLVAATSLGQSSRIDEYIVPLIAAAAFGAQRMLPVAQQVYLSWSQITGGWDVLTAVTLLLERTSKVCDAVVEHPCITLHREIKIEHGVIGYKNTEVLKNVNISIEQGKWIGVLGPSGSGKSSLADVLMGLKKLQEGIFSVDGERIDGARYDNWRKNIALVPQDIYLFDSTFQENVRFGSQARDDGDVTTNDIQARALEISQMRDFIDSLPLGFNSRVGENGSLLSGGQKQRVGFARGLCANRPVLVLDEATSALDLETEERILSSLKGDSQHGHTVIMIAHRKEALKFCDAFLVVADGTIRNFDDLESSLNFIDNYVDRRA